jgi:hypothetical protein
MVERSKIRKFSDAVARKFHPQKIILFGSYAHGHPTEDSDVDLLVIMPRTRERGERMSVRIRHAVPRDFPWICWSALRPKWPGDFAGAISFSKKSWRRARFYMKPATAEWVKKAEGDFKAAGQILRRRKDIVPDAACFFCQQSVEKYLKARLIEAGVPFP